MKKIFLVLFLIVLFLGTFYFFWLSPKYTVPILMYHNIGYEQGSFSVTPENFAKQMEHIKKHDYEVISLDELVTAIRNKKPLKRNKVVITFDDGYKDNFEYAYPVLKRFGFPATIFIITDFIGKGKIGVGKQFASWEDIVIMSKNNISFGSHTKTHFYLDVAKDEAVAWEQISGSKKIIEQKIGMPVDYFCYPSGGFCPKAKGLVVQAGYKGACTTNRGFADFNQDIYELKRIKITNADGNKPFSFWMKLSGYYNVLRKEKSPY
jgi:peptidoglycan/xylan/chitin deacetylase (PgdA/CDA1 family)